MIVLRKSKNCSVLGEIPKHDVAILAFLTASEKFSIVWNSDTSYFIVMRGQKVLIVWILDVPNNYARRRNKYKFF